MNHVGLWLKRILIPILITETLRVASLKVAEFALECFVLYRYRTRHLLISFAHFEGFYCISEGVTYGVFQFIINIC
jgi:hypothetical protein